MSRHPGRQTAVHSCKVEVNLAIPERGGVRSQKPGSNQSARTEPVSFNGPYGKPPHSSGYQQVSPGVIGCNGSSFNKPHLAEMGKPPELSGSQVLSLQQGSSTPLRHPSAPGVGSAPKQTKSQALTLALLWKGNDKIKFLR